MQHTIHIQLDLQFCPLLYDFVLVFKGNSANKFQNSTVTIDVLAEAKQHRNTAAGWDIVAQETYSLAGEDVSAVVTK